MIGIGQIGCSPIEPAQRSPDGMTCVEFTIVACQLFNDNLESLVNQFDANFPNTRFIYVDAYRIFQDMTNRPASFGFSVTNAGCCGFRRSNGLINRLPLEMLNQNRDQYLFWDAFLPSDTPNVVVGRRSYTAESPTEA